MRLTIRSFRLGPVINTPRRSSLRESENGLCGSSFPNKVTARLTQNPDLAHCGQWFDGSSKVYAHWMADNRLFYNLRAESGFCADFGFRPLLFGGKCPLAAYS